MKIETQIQDDHQARLTVEVEAEQLESAKHRAARKLANRARIPGFRPGKAPYAVIVRTVGEGALLEEAVELLVDEIYPKLIEEAKITPYGPGKLENMKSLDPLVLEFMVPLEAEVTLGDYRSVQKPYEKPLIADEDVEKTLLDLRERQAIIEPVERPAQEGDIVTVKLSATRTHPAEDQQPQLIREQSVPVLVKAADDDEWPYPGFSQHLLNLSKGDERDVSYTYADSSPYEALRGVEADFHFLVEDVKLRTLPEANDEFVSTIGEFETLDALIAEIRHQLEHQAEDSYNENYDETVLDEAVELCTVKYPPQMLEREIDDVIESLTRRLEQQKMDMDLYLKSREMDMEALRQEAKPVAEKRLKRTLVLMEIAKVEKIKLDQREVQAETLQTMNTLSNVLDKKDARRLSDRNVVQNLMNNVMIDMLNRRAIERVRDIASGKQAEIESAAAVEAAAAANIAAEIDSEAEPPVVDNTGAA